MDRRNVVLKVEVYPNGGAVINYKDKYGEHPGSTFPSFGALKGRLIELSIPADSLKRQPDETSDVALYLADLEIDCDQSASLGFDQTGARL